MSDKKKLGRPRELPRGSSPVTVRISRELHDRLARAAIVRGTSVARIIREQLAGRS